MGDGLLPPHDLAAEAAVLSAVLVEGSGAVLDLVAESLSPDSFYSEAHRRIFEASLDLHRQGRPSDLVTVLCRLRDLGRLEQVGGSAFLTEIANVAPGMANVGAYAKIVEEKATVRGTIAAGQRVAAEGYALAGNGEEVPAYLDRSAQLIFDATQSRTQSRAVEAISDIAKRTLATLSQRMHGGEDDVAERTGFASLDELIVGFQRGLFYVLAARPGLGKSALALHLALHVSREVPHRPQRHVAFFSLEMTADEIASRSVAMLCDVDHLRLQKARITATDIPTLSDAVKRLRAMHLHVNDDPSLSLFGLRAAARKLKAEVSKRGGELALIVVDYLQLMESPDRRRGESREQEVSRMSRGLKKLAKELGCAVLALAQLNRSVEERSTKGGNAKPRLADLRESGAIEQDANVVMFIHRVEGEAASDDAAKTGPKRHDVLVAKNRSGPLGSVRLMFDGAHMRWRELEAGEEPEASHASTSSIRARPSHEPRRKTWWDGDE